MRAIWTKSVSSRAGSGEPVQIALFNYRWPYLVYTRDMLDSLLDKGHEVHLFTFETWYSSVPRPQRRPGFYHHELAFTSEVEDKIHELVYLNLKSQGKPGVSRDDLDFLIGELAATLPLMAEFAAASVPDISVGIGLDKGGLLWARAWHKKTGKPYIHYSTELFSTDSDVYTWPKIAAMLPFEPEAHAGVAATIVQDADRGNYLAHYNKAVSGHVFYFPVSVKAPKEKRGPSARKLCILFGQTEGRLDEQQCLTLHRALPDAYEMLFHMNMTQGVLKRTKARYGLPNIHICTNTLDELQIEELLAQARLALCWYPSHDMNNSLTAFSSEKLARYLSLGIPVIVNADSNFHKLFAMYRCGVGLHTISQLPEAIAEIESRYGEYREAAFQAYEAYYNHDTNFERLYQHMIAAGILSEIEGNAD